MNLDFAASPSGAPPPVTGFQHSRRVGSIHDCVVRVLIVAVILLHKVIT